MLLCFIDSKNEEKKKTADSLIRNGHNDTQTHKNERRKKKYRKAIIVERSKATTTIEHKLM